MPFLTEKVSTVFELSVSTSFQIIVSFISLLAGAIVIIFLSLWHLHALSPGQTDWQVVESGRKLNLSRDLRWVAKRTRKFPRKYTQVAKKNTF